MKKKETKMKITRRVTLCLLCVMVLTLVNFAQAWDINLTGKFISVVPTGADPIEYNGELLNEYIITMEVNVDGVIVTWSRSFWMTEDQYQELRKLNNRGEYITITYVWDGQGHRIYKGFKRASSTDPYNKIGIYLYEVSPTGVLIKIDVIDPPVE